MVAISLFYDIIIVEEGMKIPNACYISIIIKYKKGGNHGRFRYVSSAESFEWADHSKEWIIWEQICSSGSWQHGGKGDAWGVCMFLKGRITKGHERSVLIQTMKIAKE